MKRNIILIAALLVAFAASAQHSEAAKSILDKTYRAYETSKGIKLSFKASSSDANGTPYEPQTGEAFIRGNKFRIEVGNIHTWFDGKTQWVWMKDLNEVNVSHPSAQEVATISPMALLGMYRKGFTVKKPLNKTLRKKNVWWIEMFPSQKEAEFTFLSVAIDKKTNAAVQVNFTLKDGTKTTLDIDNYNGNYNFSDAEFVFVPGKHPGVEVIDLR